MTGNNVSHANNNAQVRAEPAGRLADKEGRLAGRSALNSPRTGLRTVEHRGGIDAVLRSASRRAPDARTAPAEA